MTKEAEKRKQEMLRLRRKGYPLRLIGKRYGVTRQRVAQIIGRTGTVAQILEGGLKTA